MTLVAEPEPFLLPYQNRWCYDLSPVKICVKSRRIGISWATAAGAVFDAAGTDSLDSWLIGYSEDMAREFIRDCGEWARILQRGAAAINYSVLAGEEDGILTHAIRFASGSRITALSSRPTNIRGKAGHVIIDEAAFHDDLDELLKAAMALLMWGGRVSIISTHDGVDNAFNRLLNDVASGRKNYSVHRITIDDALSEGLYRRICETQGIEWSQESEAMWREELFSLYGDDANEELLCIPVNSGGTYISRGLIEAAMFPAPVLQLGQPDDFVQRSDNYRKAEIGQWCETQLLPLLNGLPKTQEHYLGIDFGRVDDLSVLAPITLMRDMSRKVPFVVELRNVPFLEQAQIVSYVLNRLPRFVKVALDSTGNGQFLGERCKQLHGGEKKVEAIWMSQKWYAENLPKLKAAFEDGTIKIPRDSDIASDLGSFTVIDGVPRLPKLKRAESEDKTKTRHGDSAIAIALAYYASLQQRMVVDYRPVKPSLGANGTPATMRTRRGAFG